MQCARRIALRAAVSVSRLTLGTTQRGPLTVVVAVAELLVVVGSVIVEETVAVFEILPIAFGRVTIFTVAHAPLANDPR
jgi:hypothetical protein